MANVRNRRLFIYLFFAIAVGVVASLALAHLGKAQRASATIHCTHYSPPYGVDAPNDCSNAYNMSATVYSTTGYAYRLSNVAAMGTNQQVCVWYSSDSNWWCNDVSSNESTEGSSGNNQPQAACYVSQGGGGLCETHWD
jgi:hypothetical protein